jgi:hypothetical protein
VYQLAGVGRQGSVEEVLGEVQLGELLELAKRLRRKEIGVNATMGSG